MLFEKSKVTFVNPVFLKKIFAILPILIESTSLLNNII
jgi:hypothetical protein